MGSKIKIVLFLVVALGAILFILRSGVIGKLGTIGSLGTFKFPGSSSSSNPAASSTPSSTPWWNTSAGSVKPASGGGSAQWYLTSSSQPVGGESWQQLGISTSDIPQGFALKDLSPYFHKIRLSSVSPGGYFGGYGQVSLYANLNGSESVNVSGWLLKANNGEQYVPQAVDIYDPSGLAAESDVHLRNGDVLNIYTSRSAIGENLHLNKCIGYMQNTNNFIPALPANCPYPNRSDVAGLSGACQNYVTSLGACAFPAANPPIPQNDYACLAYINNLNYKGCFDKHRSDSDFLSNEWRAWAGSSFLDPNHDQLLLLDRQGLLVDVYTY